MLRVCQIGLGLISKYWINALRKNPKTKLVAVCDIRPPDNLQAKYGPVVYYSDYKQCCQDPNIDVVIISTPNNVHVPIVVCALKNKKRVIVEKPISTSLAEGQQCLEVANQTNTQLYFAYHSIFGIAYKKAKQIIDEWIQKGDTLERVSSSCLENATAYSQNWIFDKAIAGGGVLIDSGINSLSILLDVIDCPVEIEETHLYFPNKDAAVEDVADVSFSTKKGIKGSMHYNWAHIGDDSGHYIFEFSSKNKLEFEWCSGQITLTQNGQTSHFSVNNRDNSVDKNQVPMSFEYVEMVADAVNFFENSTQIVNKNAMIPFIATMDAYQKATHHYHYANL